MIPAFSLLAYIDPGMGSIVLQVLIAGLLSFGVMFRNYLLKPFAFLTRGEKQPEPTEDSARQ